ncbi:MAG: DUF3465 domain-containing protein [Gemmatimonadales bacterium]
MALSGNSLRALAAILALAAAAMVTRLDRAPATPPHDAGRPAAASGDEARSTGNDGLMAAVRSHGRGRLVTVRAPVVRLLADDREGTLHQKFLLRVNDSLTVLVAHNLTLAGRVPISLGDTVVVSGEYEWTPKGGTLHWTHRDPAGRHAPGYIEAGGHRFQ